MATTQTNKRAETVWLDGSFVAWEDANVHVLTHSLHYGLAVFEGTRCYSTAKGPAVFRLHDHTDRLLQSAHILGMQMPFTETVLNEATQELIRRNEHDACYIRPIAFFGDEKVGLNHLGCKTHVAICTWQWGAYLGEEGFHRGIRCRISSFTRLHPNVAMTKAKCSGNYANSQLARAEAARDGYDEAILLDPDGYAVEGSGENLFVVEKERIVTPPIDSVLPGITRATVIEIAQDLGLEVAESRISRDRLYAADEVFFTGTAAEVTPVREIDHRTIGGGARGPITEQLQTAYLRCVRGETERYQSYLTPVTQARQNNGRETPSRDTAPAL